MVSRLGNSPSLAVVTPPARLLPFAVLVLASISSLAIALRIPVQFPMPGYFEDVRQWAAYGHIDDTFTPLAYPLFAGPAYRLAGTAGIVVLQALLFVMMVWVAIRVLQRLQVPVEWAAAGGLLILFHPELSLSIPKVWDVDLSVFLLLLFVLLCLRLPAQRLGASGGLAMGLVLGAAVFCRPNFVLLVAPLLYALGDPAGKDHWRSRRAYFATAVLVAAAVFAMLGVVSHGSPFLPRNGPYNLYAGNNRFTEAALLEKLNAEPSIAPAFAAAYPAPVPDPNAPDVYFNPTFESFYTHQAALFVRQHPWGELKLVVLKLFTLFRPDTKVHGLETRDGFGKLLLALPAAVFLLLLVAPGRPPLSGEDRLLLVVYAAYILPFLLTNSDPRFRIPLDALLLLHCVRLVYVRVGSRVAVALPIDGLLAHPAGAGD